MFEWMVGLAVSSRLNKIDSLLNLMLLLKQVFMGPPFKESMLHIHKQTSVESQSNKRLFLDGKNQVRHPKGGVIWLSSSLQDGQKFVRLASKGKTEEYSGVGKVGDNVFKYRLKPNLRRLGCWS